uniref:Uncharacterized protein n=1 Tax=Panagrolaimus sp. ES5 TaxID=591445 RepID=A0AC34FHR9_9BILA
MSEDEFEEDDDDDLAEGISDNEDLTPHIVTVAHGTQERVKQSQPIIKNTVTQSLESSSSARNIQTLISGPKFEYKPLPLSGTFIFDHRTDRKLIDESIPKNADFKCRTELLDQNDIEFIKQFVIEHFVKESNIMRHLRIKDEELIELIHPLVDRWIKCENSIVIKHKKKIIGTAFGSLHTSEEFEELYRGQLFHENPQFVNKDDYAEDIKNGPFKSLNNSRVAVLLNELEWQTGKFLPKGIQKFGELTVIHPNYYRFGFATSTAAVLPKIMFSQGCTHDGGDCVAMGTYRMSKRFYSETLFSMPYDRYFENGKPVFQKMYDEATAAHFVFFDYAKNKLRPKYVK